MKRNIWSGPALSNPRNVRTMVAMTNLNALPIDVRNALLEGKVGDIPPVVLYDFGGKAVFLGTVEITNVVYSPERRSYRFHVSPHPNDGSRFWRVFYEIEAVVVAGGDVKVARIDVAPDDPADDAEHAPPSPA